MTMWSHLEKGLYDPGQTSPIPAFISAQDAVGAIEKMRLARLTAQLAFAARQNLIVFLLQKAPGQILWHGGFGGFWGLPGLVFHFLDPYIFADRRYGYWVVSTDSVTG